MGPMGPWTHGAWGPMGPWAPWGLGRMGTWAHGALGPWGLGPKPGLGPSRALRLFEDNFEENTTLAHSGGSSGSDGDGVSRCGSDPPFLHAGGQDDVSSQANSLNILLFCSRACHKFIYVRSDNQYCMVLRFTMDTSGRDIHFKGGHSAESRF